MLDTKALQEYLCLHDYALVIDGIFGPATLKALQTFEADYGLPPTAHAAHEVVSPLTAAYLRRPITEATRSKHEVPVWGLSGRRDVWREALLWIAWRQLHWQAREVGRQNCGPWVRAYMDGRDGKPFAWCAGFVETCMRMALQEFDRTIPASSEVAALVVSEDAKERWWWTVSGWARKAEEQERLLKTPEAVRRGDLFLVRKKGGEGYSHIGIVASAPDVGFSSARPPFLTLEGNSNEAGAYEGVKVVKRTRTAYGKHFISLVEV